MVARLHFRWQISDYKCSLFVKTISIWSSKRQLAHHKTDWKTIIFLSHSKVKLLLLLSLIWKQLRNFNPVYNSNFILLTRINMKCHFKFLMVRSSFNITEGSRLMRISLLQFFKKIHKFALCEFMPYVLGYFISSVQFLPNVANANFC